MDAWRDENEYFTRQVFKVALWSIGKIQNKLLIHENSLI